MKRQEPRFFYCDRCKVIIEEVQGRGVSFTCCGTPLKELVANTTDAAHEKHLPVVKTNGNEVVVTVGSTIHPMSEEHSIEWVYLLTEKGGQLQKLSPSEEPIATFLVAPNDAPIATYSYCNLHGFWKTDI